MKGEDQCNPVLRSLNSTGGLFIQYPCSLPQRPVGTANEIAAEQSERQDGGASTAADQENELPAPTPSGSIIAAVTAAGLLPTQRRIGNEVTPREQDERPGRRKFHSPPEQESEAARAHPVQDPSSQRFTAQALLPTQRRKLTTEKPMADTLDIEQCNSNIPYEQCRILLQENHITEKELSV
ncbi:Protein of unknown function [Gryllus bimaculatus]|nr:Protein of unknown function [Gryllus bimaculatus]